VPSLKHSRRQAQLGAGCLGSLAFGLVVLTALNTAPAEAARPGALDPSFGRNGKVTTNFGHYNYAADAAIDGDGRIVAVGHPEGYDFGLARYRRSGKLDRTFSGNGKVARGVYGTPSAVTIDAKQRIVVAGSYGCDGDDCSYSSAVLARYKPNGTIDRSFGFGGRVGVEFEGYDDSSFASVTVDTKGRIVVAGEVTGPGPSWSDFALARYRPNGSLDQSFGGDGTVTTDFRGRPDGAHAVAIDPQGRIVAAGAAQLGLRHADFALARYLPNGALDATFDGDGRITTHLGHSSGASSLIVDSQGRIVAAGLADRRGRESKFGLARYLPSGELDSRLGGDGTVTTKFGREHNSGARAVAIDTRGRIVAVGSTEPPRSNGNFALARYWPSGNLDQSFSHNGKVTTTLGGDDEAASALLSSRGRIVAVGGGGRKADFALARYVGYRRR
jgi:uncharacterized delta-60 repeat protein